MKVVGGTPPAWRDTTSLGEVHKTQERKVMLGAHGLASMTLFLEVLYIYHHSQSSKGTDSSKGFLKNTV